jgi:hypothetical protein
MARFTITTYTRVIEQPGSKVSVSVANVTILGGWKMACRFHNIRIVRNKLAGMTAFAATGETWVNSA